MGFGDVSTEEREGRELAGVDGEGEVGVKGIGWWPAYFNFDSFLDFSTSFCGIYVKMVAKIS